jgi:hypothetical protein
VDPGHVLFQALITTQRTNSHQQQLMVLELQVHQLHLPAQLQQELLQGLHHQLQMEVIELETLYLFKFHFLVR